MRSNYAAKLASTPEADDDEIERMDDRASLASSGTSMFGGQKAEHIVAARSMRVELAAEIKRFIAFFDQAVKTGDASDHGDADDIRSVVVKMAQEFVAFVQVTFPTDSGEDFRVKDRVSIFLDRARTDIIARPPFDAKAGGE